MRDVHAMEMNHLAGLGPKVPGETSLEGARVPIQKWN